MSMQSPVVYCIPAETIRVAIAAFPKGNLSMEMYTELGMRSTNAQFRSLFSTTGQPALDPARLALVLVFQFLEGLSDRQAADAVRSRIDWKYALALELTNSGFDASVLSEFRQRIITGNAEDLLLTTLLTDVQDHGLLKARGKQRTDSTHVLAAVRTLNRLELLVETVRYALNRLATSAPTWLRSHMQPFWAERYADRAENDRLPKAETARQELAAHVGTDGCILLVAAYAADAPAAVRTEPAIEVLRQIGIQQCYGPDDPPPMRTISDAPESGTRITSPYDIEARDNIKRGTAWIGYTAHVTETCDPQSPHGIINVRTTPATVQDDDALTPMHTALALHQLLPSEHLVDSGYTNVRNLQISTQHYGVDIVGPVATDPSWQARSGAGFDHTQFTIDWEQQLVICPAGKQRVSWKSLHDTRPSATDAGTFARADGPACASRSKCTQPSQSPRQLTLESQELYRMTQNARQRQQTPEFKAHDALRSGVESRMSQAVRVGELRRSRYLGQARTHVQHLLTAVAINLIRMVAWLRDPKPTPTRISAFARLVAPG